ncbi:MAG: hypothetical protein IOC39_17100 [Burkholderia sp.]|jgi:type III secretion inner rod protein HrpB2|uniref:hypothetical protein n=1 Tax=Burkholderia TaxID=32008 RepID=UPI00158D94FF|nr:MULTISPECIES: hypothetical protein [Burkholderia]MBY8606274.1 hypothetical protein [Burkholderia arboris]MCA3780502.1 hypothetical protein [Burkholderia sp.]MCA3787064.1 hypothetical protein [Burkholderia sp.]MCA3791071.1 hypothetical protein [Burkholderia sp.]MCA3801597.1 hypothetical protein [Burkholderia sp.]
MSQAIASQMIDAALTDIAQGGDAANAGAAEKFQALMNQPHLVPPGTHHDGAAGVDGGSVIAEMLTTHDAAAQHAMDRITRFSEQSDHMDVKQVLAESADAAMEMYRVQFDFQAKMSVVSSSRSSAETLMKNQ